jgi:hypothetical protein
MAICPEIEIFTDEDPFIYYARWLINSFKNTYGADIYSYDGKNVFEYSSEAHTIMDSPPYIAEEYEDLLDTSSIKSRKVNTSVNWETSLPLYIKGPGWGSSVFPDYSVIPWDVRTASKEGWADLAGALVVHPMLRLDHDKYAQAFVPDREVTDLPWDDRFRGTSKIQGAYPLDSLGFPQVDGPLKLGFILEVLAAFIHIHDEAGGALIRPDMDGFTWCQMFWSGYEIFQGSTYRYLGAGTSAESVGEESEAWGGVFNHSDSTVGLTRIRYVPRQDERYEGSVLGDRYSVEPQGAGPIHATNAQRIGPLDNTFGVQGHSVKINNAGYSAFLFWLKTALELLDGQNLGPVLAGPARTSALTAHDDFLSQVFIDGGGAPKLSAKQCQETGAPYGGTFSDGLTVNTCNIKVFRAMADILYFNEDSLADTLDDLVLDYWNSFLDQHSVSISLSTEALNEAILGSGVGEYCDAASLDSGASGLDFKSINVYEKCRVESDDLQDLISEPELTCIPDPQAIIPNWLNQPEGEPFFNKKLCEYSIVMFADPPSCSEEYFASFIPEAVNKLLDYYNKQPSSDFLNLTAESITPINSRDALINGSGGLYLDSLIFSGTAQVKNFYIPPRPLEKTKVLITVAAEEFNRIPEKEAEVVEGAVFPEYLNGEPSFVVFLASEMKSIFDKVANALSAYEALYAKWHLETGKTIKGLNFKNDVVRLDSFYKETELLLKQSGYRLSDLKWVEIGFSPEYEIEYVKTQEPNSTPVRASAGFASYKSRSPMIDKTTAAYVSRLPDMADDLTIRQPMSWYDMIKKYRFPLIEEAYSLDLSSPTTDNEGLKEAEQIACPEKEGGYFEPNPFFGDIGAALLSQLSSNPCVLVDAKILEQQGREDFAMQITDMTLKEYLTSDRFINDLPELLVRGRFDDLESLYSGMLNNLGTCGIIDLIKSAVDCLLNALGYDDAISIILAAAVRGMGDDFIGKFIGSLGPSQQQLIIASVQESIPGLLPLLASYVQVVVVDGNGDVVDPEYDNPNSYTSDENPLGTLTASAVSEDPPSTRSGPRTEVSLKSPPNAIGSLGKEERAATAQDYALLKDLVADMIVNELLNLDEVLNVLNNIPGASVAVNILKKMDKYCVAPPLIYPPLQEFIQLPGIQIDVCEKIAKPTIPVFPKIQFGTISSILIDNAFRVLEELIIRLLILTLKKILQIIAEELCKTRLGPDPLGLRDALKNGLCGDSDVDSEVVDAALTDLIGALGCLTDPTAVGRLVDNIAASTTQCEFVDLVRGDASDVLYQRIVNIVKADPITMPLSECLYDKESVQSFFQAISTFVDLDQLCIGDPADLPVSREVCDNMGLLQVFRSLRADALRDKGVDEECIEGQLCVLRDQTIEDLEDLMSLLQVGIFDSIMPNVMSDAISKNPSLLPADMPTAAVAVDNLYNNILDSMSVSFTDDVIGKRGFLNMVLADSRGRGYREHLNFQKSFVGPTALNIYGSRGTRAYPPRDEWGDGANSPKDWNEGWIDGPRDFTDDSSLWRLPYLFNPLSSTGTGNTEDDTGTDSNGDATKGRPPAIGGLPDKVAGYLQDEMDNLGATFSIDGAYSTTILWEDYDEDHWSL